MSARCVAVAVSGGRDSMALLHATLRAAAQVGIRVAALHVHHGLQPQAEQWLGELQRRCKRWARDGAALSFHWRRLQGRPAASESVEAWARRERYAALGEMACEAQASLVLLAHHRRDQAETFLLQALRGGGAAGLAAMPRSVAREGIAWARPWLDMPREAVEAYVRRYRLWHIDDASNDDPRFARNRLRLQVWPSLLQAFAEAEGSLASAARRAQQEAACLEELACMDLATACDGDSLDIERWAALSPARRANALRAWLRARAGRGASETLLRRLLDEVPAGRSPARWPADEGELRRYRGVLSWSAARAPSMRPDVPATRTIRILGPGRFLLPAWGGVLHVEPVHQGGVALDRLADARLVPRRGGEQFQHGRHGVARVLKKQYQAAGVAAWRRTGPLLYCGEQLVFVPGLGVDGRALAPSGVPQVGLRWEPVDMPGETP
ncbi:MAG: tRNA lysidine(34) synthetase TilS [Pseudomonadota bacterium]